MSVRFNNTQAAREGWSIFECGDSDNGPWQLQRVDEDKVFPDDDAAWKFVTARAREGSAYHVSAIGFLRAHNPSEYYAIHQATAFDMDEFVTRNNIRIIRRTLERIRVLALNGEFSGRPAYEVLVDGKSCHCAVGALLHPVTLHDITRIGSNEKYIGDVLLELKVTNPIEFIGLDRDRLSALQSHHDHTHAVSGYAHVDMEKIREGANRDVLRWATHELATLF